MKKSLQKSLRVILFLLLGLLLLWLSFRGIDFRELGKILSQAHYLWLIPAIAASIIAFFIRSRRWILLIEPLGHKPTLLNTYHSVMTGYFANMLFPRLGEVTRCAALGKKEKLPFDKLVGTVIVERTIDFLTLLVLLGLALFGGNTTTGHFISENIISPIGVKLSCLFGSSVLVYSLLIGLLSLSIYLYFRLRNRLSGKPFFRKIYSFIDGIFAGLKSIASLNRKWEFIILTILMWFNYLLMAYFPLLCLDATAGTGMSAAVFILIIGSLGMAAPVQSGFGAFHWIVSRGLLVVYSIPKEEGLAYATISHESQLILIAVLGAISFFILFGRKSGHIFTSPAVTEE